MNKKELQTLLKLEYKRQNWQTIFREVLPNVSLRDSTIQIKSHKNKSNIEHFSEIGESILPDGEIIKLFEVKVTENTNLIKNRVALNKEISSHIGYGQADGVIAIFEKGVEEYRLTFTASGTVYDDALEDFRENATNPKRLTYLLGATESCKTPAERLSKLSEAKEELWVKDIEDAFSVEALSKLFFKEYITEFDKLVEYLKSKPTYFQAIFERDETATRNYVKRFMGRLVFLKFIQKKGWLGVPISEKGWDNGDYNFLESAFAKAKSEDKVKIFVSHFLNPLLCEALNKGGRLNDEFQNRGYKIPHLSGGLFESENSKDERIDFDEDLLTDLFAFFERYNFTIDENDINDKEVGIDPEMLGHIFENLLEDNKDKGAFYTPKEIVRYMCQESLKEYLKTYLEKEGLWPSEVIQSEALKKVLTAFVEKKETARMARYDKEIATALRDVKICDPAIGSGAFPMGLLNEIFVMIRNLHDESPDRVGEVWGMQGDMWEPNVVKQNIIQNSIYGVDIEPGAVDIARLRFWLSLVIEEETPKPLPHLDYKIVVGNSIVSRLDDTMINIEWDLQPELIQADIFGNEGKLSEKREMIKSISFLQKKIFEPDSDEKSLAIAIRDKKIDLLILQLEIMITEKGVEETRYC